MLPQPPPVLGPEWAERVRRARPRRALAVAGAMLLVGAFGSLSAVQQLSRTDVRAQSAGQRLITVSGPETARVGEPVTITVAVKANNVLDATYLGTVHFSVQEDPTAVVPNDYAFTTEDGGTHTFSQAVTFSQPGLMTLVVADTSDTTLTNEISFDVTGSGTGGTGDQKPVITEPISGTTVNQSTLTIRGIAGPSATVTILDNDVEIGVTSADTQGSFSYDATGLAENTSHRIVAMVGATSSDAVTVTIQTAGTMQAPDLVLSHETVTVTPGETPPQVDAAVSADAGLRSVQLQVDHRTIDLVEVTSYPGTYQGSFSSPMAPGSYPVDVLITNALGTSQPYSGLKTLVVVEEAAPSSPPPSASNTPPTVQFSFEPTEGPVPLTVTFTSDASDAEDGSDLTYLWDFGDGETSTEPSPTHVYTMNGPYTPLLTVTDSGGLSASAQASTSITPTGPAGLVALLAIVSALSAYALRKRTA